MENTIYCVWCGSENPVDGQTCQKCGKKLKAKNDLLVEFLVEHTKDKLKGDVEDGLFEALKNYLLSHLYSVIIALVFAVTAVAAMVIPTPGDHVQQVSRAPATLDVTATQETTLPVGYVLTQKEKEEIYTCLQAFTDCMEYTRYVGGDDEFLNYVISDALEESIGYDSYVDMYPDQVMDDVYDFAYTEYGELTMDETTWSTEPLTENGKELVDMGYTIATVYADYVFYGKRTGMSDAPTELLGSPRYLMTFAIENGQWLLVEQINVKDRWEERQDALL